MFDFGKRKYYRFFTLGFWKALLFPPNPDHLVQYLPGDYRINPLGVHEFKDMRPQVRNSSDRLPQNGRGYQFDGVATVEFNKADIDLSGATYLDFEMDMIRGDLSTPDVSMEQYDSSSNRVLIFWNNESNNTVYFAHSDGSSGRFNTTYGKHTFRFIYDGTLTSNENRCKIYEDGVQQVLTFAGTIPANTGTIVSNLNFGKTNGSVTSGGQLSNIIQRDINGKVLHKWDCAEGTGLACLDSAGLVILSDDMFTDPRLETFSTWNSPDIAELTTEETYNGNATIKVSGDIGSGVTKGIAAVVNGTSYCLKLTVKGEGVIRVYDAAGTVNFQPEDIRCTDTWVTHYVYATCTNSRNEVIRLYVDTTNGDTFYVAEWEFFEGIPNANGVITNPTLPDFHIKDIRFASELNRLGYSEGLYCITSGLAYMESNVAYGIWIQQFNRKAGGISLYFISNNTNITVGNQSYRIVTSGEAIYLQKKTPSTITLDSATGIIKANTDYTLFISRDEDDGSFEVWIKGGIYSEYTLVLGAVDNTYTTSNYVLFDYDAGQEITRWQINNEVIKLHNFTDDTGTYGKLFIPAKSSTLDTLNNPLQYTGEVRNNAIINNANIVEFDGVDDYAKQDRDLTFNGTETITIIADMIPNGKYQVYATIESNSSKARIGVALNDTGSNPELHFSFEYNGVRQWYLSTVSLASVMPISFAKIELSHNGTKAVIKIDDIVYETYDFVAPIDYTKWLDSSQDGSYEIRISNESSAYCMDGKYSYFALSRSNTNTIEYTFSYNDYLVLWDSSGNGNHISLYNINYDTFWVNDESGKAISYNLAFGFDLWERDSNGKLYYILFDNNGNSIRTNGDAVTGYTWLSRNPQAAPTGKLYHNGCEATIENYKTPAPYKADLEMKFLYGVEHITNGRFENNIDGWTSTTATLTYETADALSGIGSCFVEQVSSGGNAYQGLSVVIPAGSKIRVRVIYKSVLASTGAQFRVYLRETGGTYVTTYVDEPSPMVAGETYYLDNILDIANEINRIYVGSANSGAKFIIDNVSVVSQLDTPYPIPYDEIDYDKYDKHRLFANAEEKAKRDMVLYDEPQTGDGLLKSLKFIKWSPL